MFNEKDIHFRLEVLYIEKSFLSYQVSIMQKPFQSTDIF